MNEKVEKIKELLKEAYDLHQGLFEDEKTEIIKFMDELEKRNG